jgi:hypothetical protein
LNWDSTDKNPALKNLNILIGNWEMSGRHRLIPNPIIGSVNFTWIDGESFLMMRTDFNHSGPPNSTAIIGSDDSAGILSMLYFDERGVSRIYEMEFGENIWKIRRNFPGFYQRFIGGVKDSGNTIEGVWELSKDDINWENDLQITYTRTEKS